MVEIFFPSWLFGVINFVLISASGILITLLRRHQDKSGTNIIRSNAMFRLNLILLGLITAFYLFFPLFYVEQTTYKEIHGLANPSTRTEKDYFYVGFLNFMGHDQPWIKFHVFLTQIIFGLHFIREIMLKQVYNKLYSTIHWLIVLASLGLQLIFILIFDQTGTILYYLSVGSGIDTVTYTYLLRDYQLGYGIWGIVASIIISFIFLVRQLVARKEVFYPSEQLYPVS